MDWFRSHHGAPTDPKWIAIAKRVSALQSVTCVPGTVACFWWALEDHASQNEDRGSVAGFDVEAFSAFSGFDHETLCNALRAFQDKEMIVNQRIRNWEKRQPKREDYSTERVRRHRNALKRGVTHGNARGEEIREEKISTSLRSVDMSKSAFEAWWKHWPNKQGKAPAAKAFAVAIAKTTLDELIAGAQRYAQRLAEPNPPTAKFPQGWLNDERWNDQPQTNGVAHNGHGEQADEAEARRSAERVAIVVERQQRRAREGLGLLPDGDAGPVLSAVPGG